MTASQKQIAYQVIVITEQLLLYLYPSSRMAHDAEFEENKHPRKKDGKFAPKGQEERTGPGRSIGGLKGKEPSEPVGTIRHVYGSPEVGGGDYKVINGSQYKENISMFNGNFTDNYSAKVPENNTDNLEVYRTPYSHKYVPNAIMSNGRIVLNSNTANGGNRRYAVREMVEAECARLGGALKDGEFYRETDNPKEIDLIKQGKIRRSKNYATGERESGLSTWEKLNYSGKKYVYKISGKPISVGSDDEPVLDLKSLKVIGKEMPSSQARYEYIKKERAGEEIFKKRFGWTQAQINAAAFRDNPAKEEYKELP